MTELDQALEKCFQDDAEQTQFYDLVLNTNFYIPTQTEEGEEGKTELTANESVAPVILESEGKHYMMLFDREERLNDWAKETVSFVVFPGYALTEMTPPTLHWAMNIGSDFAKEFVPEEISWLRDVVRQCNADAGKDETTDGED